MKAPKGRVSPKPFRCPPSFDLALGIRRQHAPKIWLKIDPALLDEAAKVQEQPHRFVIHVCAHACTHAHAQV